MSREAIRRGVVRREAFRYIDPWSLAPDLKILRATIPVALFGRGGR